MKIPINTYRIQFNKNFTFKDLKTIIPYLKELGIECIYASPIFKAVPGSDHGYDQTDPHQINPEIGTLTELRIIKEELKKKNIKWMQDIVPNHMAFHKENYWLMDVLEKGKESEFRNFFDINWHHPFFKGKLMTPVLNESLEEAIESDKITLKLTDHGICISYYDHSFPASIHSYKFIIESASILKKKVLSIINRDDEIQENLNKFSEDKYLLKRFLDLQNFELVHWQQTDKIINYRRFFTINSLICLRMEEESVFEYYHKFIFQMVKDEIFDGLRIDHIDGLLEPDIYLERLRNAVKKDVYLVVEKILEPYETLPHKLPVQGTTGYDFLANVNRLMTNTNNCKTIKNIYFNYTNSNTKIDQVLYSAKYKFLKRYMNGDLENLFFILKELYPEADKNALASILAGMPVYRLYPNKSGLSEADKNIIKITAETAKRHTAEGNVNPIIKLMLEGKDEQWHYFMQRFQQLSCPLAAKGIEDTAFYQYNLLISHNEVGNKPEINNYSVADFSEFLNKRNFHSINATSTHDTKRGEDARMRINAIVDFPEKWEEFLIKVEAVISKFNGKLPDKNDLYFLYQTIIGSLPVNTNSREIYIERLINYMIKVVREGKINSDWALPNENYEEHLKIYIDWIIKDDRFVKKIRNIFNLTAFYGSLNSLSQLVIKCTLPGVADFYQGTELWDFNFVDPDNRKPVDFNTRAELLNEIKNADYIEIINKFKKNNNAPEVKLYFANKLLQLRLELRELFLQGSFENLLTNGKYKQNVFVFKRKHQDAELIVVCGRLLPSVFNDNEIIIEKWDDTEIITQANGKYIDILASTEYIINNKIELKNLFSYFPVSVLLKK